MNKILILPSLLLSMFAGASHAAGTDCIDNWERDHSVSYQECTAAQMPVKERAQTELNRIAETNNAPLPIASQSVLCSQCHQSFVQMGQMSGSAPPEM